MTLLLIFLGIITFILTGFLFLNLFSNTNFALIEKLALSFLTGNTIIIFPYFYLYFFNIPCQKFFAISIVNLSCAYLLLLLYKIKKSSSKIISSTWLKIKLSISSAQLSEKILTSVLIFIIIYAFIKILHQPINTNDSLSYWTYYSKIFYYEKTIYSDAFTDKDRVLRAKDYPFFLSMTETFLLTITGKYDDHSIKLLFFFYFVAFLIIFYYRIKSHVPTCMSLIYTILLFSLPAFLREETGGISSAMADVPFTLCHTVALLLFVSFLINKQHNYILISSILLSSTLFIKNEGFITYLSFLSTTLLLWKKLRPSPKLIALFFALPIIINLPWFYFKFFIAHPLYSSNEIQLHPPHFILVPLKIIIYNFTNYKSWGTIWLIPFMLIFSIRKLKGSDPLFLLIFITLQSTAYLAIIMILPFPTHLAMHRFLLHLLPEIIWSFAFIHHYPNSKTKL